MIVTPKINKFGDLYISMTSHPLGCAEAVKRQIDYVKDKKIPNPPKKVLVLGASSGYGLSSRIVAAASCSASTIGVFFEKPARQGVTATGGWYNTVAFERYAQSQGLYAKSINGDAFSADIKRKTLDLIKQDWGGKVDLVVYSLAAPRRTTPEGKQYSSVIKPIGKEIIVNDIDLITHQLSKRTITPATPEEVDNTVKVMGGEDWELWIEALLAENMLHKDSLTVAYSYIGGEHNSDIYREGSLGKAKQHLEETGRRINALLEQKQAGRAYTVLNKAVLTLAISAIPGALQGLLMCYKIMRPHGLHEDPIRQIWRLFADRLYLIKDDVFIDNERRIRLDEWELQPMVQEFLSKGKANAQMGDLSNDEVYKIVYNEFLSLYGFGFDNVDYNADVEIDVPIPSIAVE